MTTNHAPEKWEVVDHPVYPSFKDLIGPSFKVSVVMHATDLTFGDYLRRDADLHLMSAAPDMFAALEGVLRVADRATVEFDAARAALAKARGTA
jgi:hypothetical protein